MAENQNKDVVAPLYKFSSLDICALSIGGAIGWGFFNVPEASYLPIAGPIGTLIGVILSTLFIFLIGVNYLTLIKKYSNKTSSFDYIHETFGFEHGFVCIWFSFLIYSAMLLANTYALGHFFRILFGISFSGNLLYNFLDSNIHLSNILISCIAISIFAAICLLGNKISAIIQKVTVLFLCLGVLLAFILGLANCTDFSSAYTPAFAPNDSSMTLQIGSILLFSFWGFIGFESITNYINECNCKTIDRSFKSSLLKLGAAVSIIGIMYILITQVTVLANANDHESWNIYLSSVTSSEGFESFPTILSVKKVFGGGLFGDLMAVALVLAAIFSSFIVNIITASRVVRIMSNNEILPDTLNVVNKHKVPSKAILLILGIAILMMFIGKAIINCIVDVATIGAAILYGYISAATIQTTKFKENKFICISGILGLVLSVIIFTYVMFSDGSRPESFIFLIIWCLLGLVYFRHILNVKENIKLGNFSVVLLGLLFIICLSSIIWVKATIERTIGSSFIDINSIFQNYEQFSSFRDVTEMLVEYQDRIIYNSDFNLVVQIVIILICMFVTFNLFKEIKNKEQALELKRLKAEESSRAKTIFLSNMSHDIRTPMNAIVGYIHMIEEENYDPKTLKDYISKVKISSEQLLSLINDILEMSRIENKKVNLEIAPLDFRTLINQIKTILSNMMASKRINFTIDDSQVKNYYIYADKKSLERVLMNLLGNAQKFTPNNGNISLTVKEYALGYPKTTEYEIRVKDNGIGMSKEFATKIFEAFERERTSTVSGLQGTGLGMAITKSLIDLMGGTIEVETEPYNGTEFIIHLKFDLLTQDEIATFKKEQNKLNVSSDNKVDFIGKRVLLVEDIFVNREIASKMLKKYGFTVEVAENGKEATEKVAVSEDGYYDLILMDIQMPIMDGYEATKWIRKLNNPKLANIPIIAVSANAFVEDVKKAKEVGMNGHISKPINFAELKKTLVELFSNNESLNP